MTTQQLINYYANLLILQYIGKPNAYATVQTLVTPVIMDQLPIAVQNAFNMDGTAQGVQLDVLGKYVGVTRTGYDFNGPITLNDTDFMVLIRLAIAQNNAGSSLATIQNFLATFFLGAILVFDYKTMRLSYLLNSGIGSQELAELIVKQNLLPKPMGVQLSSVVYGPVLNTFFGFRTYTLAAMNSSPFNTYGSYSMSAPWLNKSNLLTL